MTTKLLKSFRRRFKSVPEATPEKSERQKCRVMVMGPACVGKTSLIKRFISDEYTYIYEPTVEDTYEKSIICDDVIVDLKIVDTSGSIPFPAMRRLNISNADVILIVFSLIDMKTFEEIPSTVEEIRSIPGCENKKIVIVGNKCDEIKRVMKMELADATVCVDWGHKYVETSAMDYINIESMFLLAASQTLNLEGNVFH